MTLLTQKMNSAAKNYDFAKKQMQYQQTKLAMTQNLSLKSVVMDENFISNRHSEILNTLFVEFELK